MTMFTMIRIWNEAKKMGDKPFTFVTKKTIYNVKKYKTPFTDGDFVEVINQDTQEEIYIQYDPSIGLGLYDEMDNPIEFSTK